MKKYEFLEHPADIKIRAYGEGLTELFANAATGMMDFIYEEDESQITETEDVFVEAADLESLLVNWLAELLWLSDTKHCRCKNFDIDAITSNSIKARIALAHANAKDDIKAVTYNELKIIEHEGIWIAEVVFDI